MIDMTTIKPGDKVVWHGRQIEGLEAHVIRAAESTVVEDAK